MCLCIVACLGVRLNHLCGNSRRFAAFVCWCLGVYDRGTLPFISVDHTHTHTFCHTIYSALAETTVAVAETAAVNQPTRQSAISHHLGDSKKRCPPEPDPLSIHPDHFIIVVGLPYHRYDI